MRSGVRHVVEALGADYVDSIAIDASSGTFRAGDAIAFFPANDDEPVADQWTITFAKGSGGPVFDALRSSLAGRPADAGWVLFDTMPEAVRDLAWDMVPRSEEPPE